MSHHERLELRELGEFGLAAVFVSGVGVEILCWVSSMENKHSSMGQLGGAKASQEVICTAPGMRQLRPLKVPTMSWGRAGGNDGDGGVARKAAEHHGAGGGTLVAGCRTVPKPEKCAGCGLGSDDVDPGQLLGIPCSHLEELIGHTRPCQGRER